MLAPRRSLPFFGALVAAIPRVMLAPAIVPTARAHCEFTSVPIELIRDVPDGVGLGRPLGETLAAGPGGTWIAAWTEIGPSGGLLVSRSTDDGQTWSPATTLAATVRTVDPVLVTDDAGNWMLAYGGNEDESGEIAYVSTNDGASWSAPIALGTSDTGGVPVWRSNMVVATDKAGTWVVAWWEVLDSFNQGSRTMFRRSTTGPLGPWSVAAPLNAETDDTVPPGQPLTEPLNYPLDIVTDGSGTWLIGFEASSQLHLRNGGVPRPEDHSYVRSTDGGASWSAPDYFLDFPGTAGDYALQNSGGFRELFDLDVDANGRFVAVWTEFETATLSYRGLSVFSDDGANWSPPSLMFLGPVGAAPRPFRLGRLVSTGPGGFLAFVEAEHTAGRSTSLLWRSTDGSQTWGTHGFVEPSHELASTPDSRPVAAAVSPSGAVGLLMRRHAADAASIWEGNSIVFAIDPGDCGDGTVEVDEECDDANRDAGDGCSPSCTIEDCWQCTGPPDPCVPLADGTACLDGESCTTGDECTAGVCGGTPLADGTSCSDGLLCNGVDVCDGGVCAHQAAPICNSCEVCVEPLACVPGPANGCYRPLPGIDLKLSFRDNPLQPYQRRFKFKWVGSATALPAFGDPLATDSFELCFGPKSGASYASDCSVLSAASACGSKPCWKSRSGGFAYSDPRYSAYPSFVRKFLVKEGADGKAQIKVVGGGRGMNLYPVGQMPLPFYVGVRSTTGSFWEATFTEDDLRKQSSTSFSMKGGS